MRAKGLCQRLPEGAVVTAPILGMVGVQTGGAFAASGYGPSDYDGASRTPIRHVIIIIGENRTFDHIYAT